MTQEEAIRIFIQTALVAQSKGALTLDDAVIVKQAIDLFTQKPASEETANAEVVNN